VNDEPVADSGVPPDVLLETFEVDPAEAECDRIER
jgi:hypothetical protein